MGKVAGYILAGGKNSRMNGEKKLFLSFCGESFFDSLVRALEPLNRIYLSVESPEPYEDIGDAFPLIADRYPQIGPLGGIYSGLCQCEEDALLVLPCDTPRITREVTGSLIHIYEATGKPVITATSGNIHPLTGIYTKECIPVMKQMIEHKEYKMRNLLKKMNYETFVCLEEILLDNINTREEYDRLRSGSIRNG